MKKLYVILAFVALASQLGVAQTNFAILLVEDFETGGLPTGWTRSQAVGSDGWIFGQTGYTSTFWDVPASVDASQFAISNDDDCNCDMSDDQLNSPLLDLSNFDSAYFLFDRFYDGAFSAEAYMQLSYDGGATWVYLALTADPAWVEDGYAVPASINVGGTIYNFNDQMKVGFVHSDAGAWGSGFAIDNVIVAGFNSPCDDIIAISGCDAPQTVSLGGQGVLDFNFTGACGWDVPGAEQIYAFTPSVTGAHTISVTAATGASWLDYMYKPASAGCDSLGWICVNDVDTVGEYGAMNLVAGTQYLILVDNEFADLETQTFSISCPCTYDGIYATVETESCGADLNGGCNDVPAAYEPIACGQIITGTVWADAGSRDLDWYQLVVTQSTNIDVEFAGDLPLNVVLFDNCTNQNVLASAVAGACDLGAFSFPVTAGTYLLLVGPTTFNGYPCAGGLNEYDLYVNYCAPPANDNCGGAIALPVGTSCSYTAGSALGATESLPACVNADPGTANDDVWFSFVANSTSATINVQGSSGYDPVFEVYSGSCGSPVSLGCVDDDFTLGGLESAEFTGLTAGMTYRVRVYDYYPTAPTTTAFSICVFDDGTVTGISAAQDQSSVNVYPNPSNGSFRIEVAGEEGTTLLQVTDMVGRVVYSENVLMTNEFRKDLNLNVDRGTYVLSIVSPKASHVQKIEIN